MGTKKILVIEDDEQIRVTLGILLESEGYEVQLAKDGVEGVTFLHADPEAYSLVLLDLYMPRMTGSEVIVELRNHPRLCRIPVVLMSAAAPAQVIPIKATLTLAKPLDIDVLLATIARYSGTPTAATSAASR
ncbi:MAG: response regulator [Bdellovibrionota bacterium]